VAEIEGRMAAPDFWDRPDEARGLIGQLKGARGILEDWKALSTECRDTLDLFDLAQSEGDEALLKEVQESAPRLEQKIEALELRSFLSGQDDASGAIVSIHPGAGGTESQDWAEMLLRMYLRWIEQNGFQASILDYQAAEEAGIKDATFEVNGPYAYGYLKGESGVHRLVRISPFDAAKRRHTSFASVFVYPQVDDTVEVEIKDGDLRVDTFRASGAGGQHVNKTSSAVRLTHLPSGLVVSCQSERSQHRNRDSAMKILKARLYLRQRAEERKKMDALFDEQKEIAWGNQIRSYVFQPYTMVKDHRTNCETSDVDRVMNGDLNPFIDAYLRKR
jgi:peptide chain release factor 2